MRSSSLLTLLASVGSTVLASPVPLDLNLWAPVKNSGTNSNGNGGATPGDDYKQVVDGFVKSVVGTTESAVAAGGATGFVSALNSIKAMGAPTSVNDAAARLTALGNAVKANSSLNIHDYSAILKSLNLVDSSDSLLSYITGIATGQNSMSNVNRPSTQVIYPRKNAEDAAYTVSEDRLRAAIYIPPGFTYGKKPPVILFPGTGTTGFVAFKGNFIPLLQASDFADPVWVNVPGYLLDDAQNNAEYAAYAINYIAAITGKNVTVASWSQGCIDTQWSFKYWPSTRKVTSDHVAFSPDYKGTILASFIAPNGAPLPPSIFQQKYLADSKFITTLRNNGGDSGYVPTTTIYSGFFDEIVQPQSGVAASGFLNDARNVGVTNTEVQVACSGKLGGSFYTHEGILYNPLSFALLRDAMKNDGPGRLSRLNLNDVCSTYLTRGLDLGDLLVTENSILVAGLQILAYNPKVQSEPAIRAYATR